MHQIIVLLATKGSKLAPNNDKPHRTTYIPCATAVAHPKLREVLFLTRFSRRLCESPSQHHRSPRPSTTPTRPSPRPPARNPARRPPPLPPRQQRNEIDHRTMQCSRRRCLDNDNSRTKQRSHIDQEASKGKKVTRNHNLESKQGVAYLSSHGPQTPRLKDIGEDISTDLPSLL